MTQPSQGQDLQEGVYRTPMNLLTAINKRWPLCFDLAANNKNDAISRLNPSRIGQYYSPDDDALTAPWTDTNHGIDSSMYCWLNPPYDNIGLWTKKAEKEAKEGARVVMLIPSATGAKWLVDYCLNAQIIFLIGRPIFEFVNAPDHKNAEKRGKPNTDPYGKDLLLAIFDGMRGGVNWWDWRK